VSNLEQPVHLAGATLPHHHLCAFFHSPEERYRVLSPFVKEGIDRREKAIHVVDPARRTEHLGRLSAGGIDVTRAEESGQLEVRGWDEVYLRGGHFDQDAMLAFVGRTLAEAREQGFPRARVIGEMEWALEDRPGVQDLVRYEARVNTAFAGWDDPLLCTYDRTRFGPSLAMDVLGTHHAAVIGGRLQTNPLFGAPRRLHHERGPRGISPLRRRHLAALLAGSRRDALEILLEEGLWLDVPISTLYLQILQPALYEVGRLWQDGRMGVPQACLAAEICRAALAHLHPHLPCERNNGKVVVVACVEGELHDIGASMVADFLEMAGFDVRFLGANLPAESLVALVEEQPPELLALSATTDAGLAALRRTVEAIRVATRGRVPVAVGGQLFSANPGLREALGATLYARDASEMAAAARSLLGEPG
jgi:methanogenic corrinoid protein MtbC1